MTSESPEVIYLEEESFDDEGKPCERLWCQDGEVFEHPTRYIRADKVEDLEYQRRFFIKSWLKAEDDWIREKIQREDLEKQVKEREKKLVEALKFYAYENNYRAPAMHHNATGITIDVLEYSPIEIHGNSVAKAALKQLGIEIEG